VKLLRAVRPWAPPGPLQLAGGTNASSLGLLRPCDGAAGVAFGGMARSLLRPLLQEAEGRGGLGDAGAGLGELGPSLLLLGGEAGGLLLHRGELGGGIGGLGGELAGGGGGLFHRLLGGAALGAGLLLGGGGAAFGSLGLGAQGAFGLFSVLAGGLLGALGVCPKSGWRAVEASAAALAWRN
jgi:hypothetical protein